VRWLASVLPDWLQIVLALAGLGTLVGGTASALLLVTRFPNLHHWRLIGLFSVVAAVVGLFVAFGRQL
jgi:predicted membrane-bound spermidine synthase